MSAEAMRSPCVLPTFIICLPFKYSSYVSPTPQGHIHAALCHGCGRRGLGGECLTEPQISDACRKAAADAWRGSSEARDVLTRRAARVRAGVVSCKGDVAEAMI